LAAVIGAVALAGATYSPNLTVPAGMVGRTIEVDGTPVRVLQRGSGPDVLLIHGSPGSIEDWLPLMAALEPRFRLTAYDRPGHGYSGDPGQYSFAYNAQFALHLIEALKLRHVIVVGHSYGGSTGLAIALAGSNAVDGYVVIDSAAYRPSRPADATYRLLAIPVIGIGFARVLGQFVAPKKIARGLDAVFPYQKPSAEFVAFRSALWAQPKVAHAIAMETLGAPEALAAQSARYGEIHRPVSLLYERDLATRRETAEQLHRAIAGSTLQLFSGVGHYLQIERTADVAAAVTSLALSAAAR
ncbi:MAG TPA: alpha/beta hydrolase, partial [Polyangiales bacterium]|nr:alpha/beta hydrolase [Polyangiales bacterium]